MNFFPQKIDIFLSLHKNIRIRNNSKEIKNLPSETPGCFFEKQDLSYLSCKVVYNSIFLSRKILHLGGLTWYLQILWILK